MEELPMYLVGVAVAAVVGYFAIRLVKEPGRQGQVRQVRLLLLGGGPGQPDCGVIKTFLL